MRKIKPQPFKFTVSGSGAEVKIASETDKNYKRVKGVLITVTDEAALKKAVFSKFNVNDQELLPEGFEPKVIYTGYDCPSDSRFYTSGIDAAAEGSSVAITYTDGGSASAYPYTGVVYLLLKNPDPLAAKEKSTAPSSSPSTSFNPRGTSLFGEGGQG
jgi:hypothetical protein